MTKSPSRRLSIDHLGSAGALAPILARLRGEPSRTWSIIVTVFGDAIAPRGGEVGLTALADLFRSLDIGDGVVRTALSRLAADNLVERRKVGRNSFYALSESGRASFTIAAERIYCAHVPVYAGFLDLALPSNAEERDALTAAGFAAAQPGVFIAHAGRPTTDRLLRLRAEGASETLRTLAARTWPLDALAQSYRGFLEAFGPLRDALEADVPFSDLEALAARILLVHEFRRIVLRDPMLPEALTPEDWPGERARALAAFIYARVLDASERWLDAQAFDSRGLATRADRRKLESRFQT